MQGLCFFAQLFLYSPHHDAVSVGSFPLAFVAQSGYIVLMIKTATVRARIEPAVKRRADTVFSAIGLSATDAITLFYKQVALRKGIPFEVHIPNALTAKTIRDADNGKGLLPAQSFEAWEEELRALRP